MDNDETVELDCELLNETPKAYKINVMLTAKKSKELWVPKSQSTLVSNRKGNKITLPQWIAEKEGLL